MHIQYGEWKINADIKRTKSYYSEFKKPTDQYSRNFQAYCDGLSSEEKEFFDSLGIDPKCVCIESIGKTGRGTVPSSGYYFVYGSYEDMPAQPEISVEQLVKNGFGAALRDNSFKVGAFRFEFQSAADPNSDIPSNMPESCICLRFSCDNIKWLLKEKSIKSVKRTTHFERLFARFSRSAHKEKSANVKSFDGGKLLTATGF